MVYIHDICFVNFDPQNRIRVRVPPQKKCVYTSKYIAHRTACYVHKTKDIFENLG